MVRPAFDVELAGHGGRATLRPGVLDANARIAFSRGWCHVFALALHKETGWPLYIGLAGQPGPGFKWENAEDGFIAHHFDHMACQAPDGRYVDILGAHACGESPLSLPWSPMTYFPIEEERLLHLIEYSRKIDYGFMPPFRKITKAAKTIVPLLLREVHPRSTPCG